MNRTMTAVGIAVINLLLSIVLTFWVGSVEKDAKLSAQLILGISFFIAMSVLELVILKVPQILSELQQSTDANARLLEATKRRHELDHALAESTEKISRGIRKLREITQDRPAVLISGIENDLRSLEHRIESVLENKRVITTDRHNIIIYEVVKWLLEDAELSGRVLFQDTWIVKSESDVFLEGPELQYLLKIHPMVESGKLKRHTIFVVGPEMCSESGLAKPLAELVRFYKSHEGYEFRLMAEEGFESMKEQHFRGTPETEHCDFGIYSGKALYVTRQYSGGVSDGYWSVSESDLRLYTSFFEHVWDWIADFDAYVKVLDEFTPTERKQSCDLIAGGRFPVLRSSAFALPSPPDGGTLEQA